MSAAPHQDRLEGGRHAAFEPLPSASQSGVDAEDLDGSQPGSHPASGSAQPARARARSGVARSAVALKRLASARGYGPEGCEGREGCEGPEGGAGEEDPHVAFLLGDPEEGGAEGGERANGQGPSGDESDEGEDEEGTEDCDEAAEVELEALLAEEGAEAALAEADAVVEMAVELAEALELEVEEVEGEEGDEGLNCAALSPSGAPGTAVDIDGKAGLGPAHGGHGAGPQAAAPQPQPPGGVAPAAASRVSCRGRRVAPLGSLDDEAAVRRAIAGALVAAAAPVLGRSGAMAEAEAGLRAHLRLKRAPGELGVGRAGRLSEVGPGVERSGGSGTAPGMLRGVRPSAGPLQRLSATGGLDGAGGLPCVSASSGGPGPELPEALHSPRAWAAARQPAPTTEPAPASPRLPPIASSPARSVTGPSGLLGGRPGLALGRIPSEPVLQRPPGLVAAGAPHSPGLAGRGVAGMSVQGRGWLGGGAAVEPDPGASPARMRRASLALASSAAQPGWPGAEGSLPTAAGLAATPMSLAGLRAAGPHSPARQPRVSMGAPGSPLVPSISPGAVAGGWEGPQQYPHVKQRPGGPELDAVGLLPSPLRGGGGGAGGAALARQLQGRGRGGQV